jgi:hypothetical protein
MNISPASILLSIANVRSQALNSLVSSASDANSGAKSATTFPFPAPDSASTDPLAALTQSSSIKGLSPTGRNMALFDPESAYKMMTLINNEDVSYKAQFSELSKMKADVSQMQDAGQSLGSITTATGNDSIKSQLQGFMGQYNNWVQQFNPDMQKDGLLANTQAAQVSRYELSQSVENRFNGAKDGLHGLRDLGITIDHNTQLASLDTAKLDAVLSANKQGAMDTVQEFSANFSKSASLLNSDGNFIPHQLNNLSKVIHYIDDNEAALQKEFGSGDPAKPSGQVAQALAAYNQVYGI